MKCWFSISEYAISDSGEIIQYRNEYYKLRAKPRPIDVQIRDWLKWIGMSIAFDNEDGETGWELDGRHVLSVWKYQNGICGMEIRYWVKEAIIAGGMPNHLSTFWYVINREDLRLIMPFIRLVLDQTVAERRRDMLLISSRLSGPRLRALTALCLNQFCEFQPTSAANVTAAGNELREGWL